VVKAILHLRIAANSVGQSMQCWFGMGWNLVLSHFLLTYNDYKTDSSLYHYVFSITVLIDMVVMLGKNFLLREGIGL